MARKRSGASISSYFRDLFNAHPELLAEKSNDVLLARYREDHAIAPGVDLAPTVKNNLANMKSVMRKQVHKGGQPTRSGNRLQTLEELIDDCLTLARSIDRDSLAEVINLLRRARNEVVRRLGQ